MEANLTKIRGTIRKELQPYAYHHNATVKHSTTENHTKAPDALARSEGSRNYTPGKVLTHLERFNSCDDRSRRSMVPPSSKRFDSCSVRADIRAAKAIAPLIIGHRPRETQNSRSSRLSAFLFSPILSPHLAYSRKLVALPEPLVRAQDHPYRSPLAHWEMDRDEATTSVVLSVPVKRGQVDRIFTRSCPNTVGRTESLRRLGSAGPLPRACQYLWSGTRTGPTQGQTLEGGSGPKVSPPSRTSGGSCPNMWNTAKNPEAPDLETRSQRRKTWGRSKGHGTKETLTKGRIGKAEWTS